MNFALSNWLPVGRRARPCTCNGQQTPYIDVPLLFRRLKSTYPQQTREWWCFVCACGKHTGVTQEDAEEEQPTGEMFECSVCQQWGHVACYSEYAAAAELNVPLPEKMYCIGCRDAWRDDQHGDESWRFSCVCGQHEGASNLTAAEGEAPTGRMFQCSDCDVWAHTECYERYRGQDDDALPASMWCHRCFAKRFRAKGSSDPSQSGSRRGGNSCNLHTPQGMLCKRALKLEAKLAGPPCSKKAVTKVVKKATSSPKLTKFTAISKRKPGSK